MDAEVVEQGRCALEVATASASRAESRRVVQSTEIRESDGLVVRHSKSLRRRDADLASQLFKVLMHQSALLGQLQRLCQTIAPERDVRLLRQGDAQCLRVALPLRGRG